MKIVIATLVVLLILLQYKLWVGNGSLAEVWQLHQAIAAQDAENESLRERNQALAAEVNDLKHGLDAVEERARIELGMTKDNETYFRLIEE